MSGFLTQDAPAERSQAGKEPFLQVRDLTVRFPTYDGLVKAVSDLSYTVDQGQTLGIVGESGSGKSVSSMAVLGLHDPQSTRLEGSIKVGGQEVVGADEGTLRKLRGGEVAMIFADVRLPGMMDGVQLAKATCKLWPTVRIVLTSGDPSAGLADLPKCVTFMPKPWRGLDVLVQADKAIHDPQPPVA